MESRPLPTRFAGATGSTNLEELKSILGRTANGFLANKSETSKQLELNGRVRLPGAAFTHWTRRELTSQSVHLVTTPLQETGIISTIAEFEKPTRKASVPQPEPPPVIIKRQLSFLGWAAGFLFLCSLAAFLCSETDRQKLGEANRDLTTERDVALTDKSKFHDSWKAEELANRKLGQEIVALQGDLDQSRQRAAQLNAEKKGLSETIKDLRGSLATAIQDHRNTEASLKKVISGLEDKNAEIAASLDGEKGKLKEMETRVSDLSQQLAAAAQGSEKLAAENAELRGKLADVQTNLKQTLEAAQAKEVALKQEIEKLRTDNSQLSQSLSDQKKELAEVREQLRVSQSGANNQSSQELENAISQLKTELSEAAKNRDALASEKEALTKTIQDLNARIGEAPQQAQALEAAKTELSRRNEELQKVVDGLNQKLTSLASENEAKELGLSKKVEELTKANETLRGTLEEQRSQLQSLLEKEAREPAANQSQAEPQSVIREVKHALSQSLENRHLLEQENITLAGNLQEQSNALVALNTRLCKSEEELAAARGALNGVDDLRKELDSLRSQGAALQSELGKRESKISDLAADSSGWKTQAQHLKGLLESEQATQEKLQGFITELRDKIAGSSNGEQTRP